MDSSKEDFPKWFVSCSQSSEGEMEKNKEKTSKPGVNGSPARKKKKRPQVDQNWKNVQEKGRKKKNSKRRRRRLMRIHRQ